MLVSLPKPEVVLKFGCFHLASKIAFSFGFLFFEIPDALPVLTAL